MINYLKYKLIATQIRNVEMNNHKLVSRYVSHKINEHVQKDGNTLHTHSYVLGSMEAKVALLLDALEIDYPDAYLATVNNLMEDIA